MAKDWKKEVAYQLSTEGLKAHIASLDKPDSLFWDCWQLKKEGKKFQKLDWSVFPFVTKNEDGEWVFKK